MMSLLAPIKLNILMEARTKEFLTNSVTKIPTSGMILAPVCSSTFLGFEITTRYYFKDTT
jgi:hypothetical protein